MPRCENARALLPRPKAMARIIARSDRTTGAEPTPARAYVNPAGSKRGRQGVRTA